MRFLIKFNRKEVKVIVLFLVALLVQINVASVCPYSLESKEGSANLDVDTFQDSYVIPGRGEYEVIIYYPFNGSGKPYPAVIFAHGFCSCSSWHTWIGNYLASMGYVTLVFTVPNRLSTDIQDWVDGIEEGIRYLEQLNNESDLLGGLVNMSRLGVMGHSMGAMAALIAASKNLNIKAVVSLAAPYMKEKQYDEEYAEKIRSEIDWDSVLSASGNLTKPVQFQVGTLDAFAADNAVKYFEAANSSFKEFVTIEGGNHVQFLDDKVVLSISTLSGLISFIIPLLLTLDLETIIRIIMMFLTRNQGGIHIKIIFVQKLVGAAIFFGLDLPATISPREQQEKSSQNFLTFFDLYL